MSKTHFADDETLEYIASLEQMLGRYMGAYPAFRMKPIGAPGSPVRIEQENLMALEDAAKSLLAKPRS